MAQAPRTKPTAKTEPSRFNVELSGLTLKPEEIQAISNEISRVVVERVHGTPELVATRPEFTWFLSFLRFESYGGGYGRVGPGPIATQKD